MTSLRLRNNYDDEPVAAVRDDYDEVVVITKQGEAYYYDQNEKVWKTYPPIPGTPADGRKNR